jgi:hypothetical protein
MSYRITQDFEYAGDDYWRWWAWIEASEAELDKVREVAWLLHPSFKRSLVVAKQRSDKFRLKTAGWGTFLLKAEVVLDDGKKLPLKHNLRLEYPDSSQKKSLSGSAIPRRPTIFLSYSTQDSRVASRLRAGLEKAGLKVLDQTQIGGGESWDEALTRMIAKADAVVGLVCEDEVSPWVSQEIGAAVASAKNVLLLVAAGASISSLKDIRRLEIDLKRLDPAAIAEQLRSL